VVHVVPNLNMFCWTQNENIFWRIQVTKQLMDPIEQLLWKSMGPINCLVTNFIFGWTIPLRQCSYNVINGLRWDYLIMYQSNILMYPAIVELIYVKCSFYMGQTPKWLKKKTLQLFFSESDLLKPCMTVLALVMHFYVLFYSAKKLSMVLHLNFWRALLGVSSHKHNGESFVVA